jgi:hypothetical protein
MIWDTSGSETFLLRSSTSITLLLIHVDDLTEICLPMKLGDGVPGACRRLYPGVRLK